jgi:YfiH family protein
MSNNIDLKKYFIQPDWPAPAHIKAYTSLRESNIGKEEGIDDAQLKHLLQFSHELIWIKQVHGAVAVKALPENHKTEADAVFTDTPNIMCGVQTADCLPVLITNRQGTHVAAIHAGWRGLSQGVIEATIAKLALPPAETLVWFGPAISPAKFAVRKDVYEAFTRDNPEAKQGFNKISSEHWLADLNTLGRQRLQKLGIKNIYGGEHCTHTDQKRFFSYRRDGKIVGRIVNLIWITDS